MTLIAIAAAALLCSLVAGFLRAFAIVVMPGIGTLDDGAFIRAFQVIDRVIQDNHPLFMLMWVGSIVAILAAAGLSVAYLDGLARALVVGAAVVYIGGVQLPTFTINVPLNNTLQTLNVEELGEAERRAARRAFEPRWVRWNGFRSVLAVAVAASLIVALTIV